MIKVALMDNQELVRAAIKCLLNQFEEIEVTADDECDQSLLGNLTAHLPDIILIDPLTTDCGIETFKATIARYPDIKVIGLLANQDPMLAKRLMELGASGIVSKHSPVNELIKGLKTVMTGKYFLCQNIASTVAIQGLMKTEAMPFLQLSRRESEVAEMILQGKNIQEISRALSISDKTTNTYKYRLYNKLAIKNSVELTRLAYKFNYLVTLN